MTTVPEILTTICQSIADKKGVNIVTIDVRGVSNLADYFVIADGNVERHVQSIAEEVDQKMSEKFGYKAFMSEGRSYGDWIVLDYHEVLVHLFIPDMREKYQLETVWKDGKVVSVPISYE